MSLLGHRTTDDLDLFTTDDAAMSQADSLARALGAAVNAEVESLQTTPDHRRYLYSRGDESTRVDFVRDRAPQLLAKASIDGIVSDTVEEIIANKITTLASRSEIRDVVDLYFLERAGYRIDDHLANALRKEQERHPRQSRGCSPIFGFPKLCLVVWLAKLSSTMCTSLKRACASSRCRQVSEPCRARGSSPVPSPLVSLPRMIAAAARRHHES